MLPGVLAAVLPFVVLNDINFSALEEPRFVIPAVIKIIKLCPVVNLPALSTLVAAIEL